MAAPDVHNTQSTTPQLMPLRMEDVVARPAFGGQWQSIQPSPNGLLVAYTVQDERRKAITSDPASNDSATANSDVWVTSTRTGKATNITQEHGSGWGPSWSPDSRQLAFYRTQGNKTHIWTWNAATREMRQVSRAITPASYTIPGDLLRWSPDGQHLLTKLQPDETPESHPTRQKGQPTVRVLTEQDPCTRAHPELAVIDVTDGAVHRLTSGEIPWYDFSPDGTRIAYTKFRLGTEIIASHGAITGTDLVVASRSGADQHVVATNLPPGLGQAVSWSPDGKLLSYIAEGKCFLTSTADAHPHPADLPSDTSLRDDFPPLWSPAGDAVFVATSDHLYRVSVSAATATIAAKLPDTGRAIFGSRDSTTTTATGLSLAFLTQRPGTLTFYQADLGNGTMRQVSAVADVPANVSDLHITASGHAAIFLGQDALHPQDVWYAASGSSTPRQITRINPQFDDYVLGETRVISWKTQDGQTLHGALLLPAGYQEGRKYPLVVVVYGGAYGSSHANEFGLLGNGVDNMQLLATRGYAVLYPDAPLRDGALMSGLAMTVLPGVDEAVRMGVADPDRLGMMGHSYGGYSTLALIAQTPRFKAAVSRAGVADLVSSYGSMDDTGYARAVFMAEKGQLGMGGAPWQVPDRYVQNSPVFFLDKVQTPLLIVQGSEDTSVFPAQSEEVFVGLRRQGKEATYAKYIGEDHEEQAWSYPNQLDYCRRMLAWFEEHLKATSGTPAVPATGRG